jgi:membrane protein
MHDGVIKWKLAIGGALFTSLLMFLGQYLLRIYMGNMYFSSQFGVAGMFLMILTYVFYTSQIVFLGAKFVYVFAKVSGNPIVQKR